MSSTVAPLFTDEQCFSAMLARDHRFDGEFYIAVKTTGIYCRPSCPTPVQPKRINISFHRSAASAQQAGYRACKRCRPDSSVGSPARLRNDDVTGRALRLIEDGHIDRFGVPGLASSLHLSERQLNRVLLGELGAGPLALARARRAHVARTLIETTSISFGDVAFAAGFASIRQFNETIQAVFAASPTDLRTHRKRSVNESGSITVRLPFREPFDHEGLFQFFALRAVPGVEAATDTSYTRTLRLTNGPGVVRVQMDDNRHLSASFWLSSLNDLSAALARVRRLFDLDADPISVGEAMGTDEHLGPIWNAHLGRRAPGAVDADELAVKAVLGQQVSVVAARTLATRLANRLGDTFTIPGAPLELLFPSAESLGGSNPADVGIPMARANALVGMCAALHEGLVDLSIGVSRSEAKTQLLALRGIGPWTASYISMRALSDPDVLLDDDLGVIHGAKALGLPTERKALVEHGQKWAPWRSYATQLMWAAIPPPTPKPSTTKAAP